MLHDLWQVVQNTYSSVRYYLGLDPGSHPTGLVRCVRVEPQWGIFRLRRPVEKGFVSGYRISTGAGRLGYYGCVGASL